MMTPRPLKRTEIRALTAILTRIERDIAHTFGAIDTAPDSIKAGIRSAREQVEAAQKRTR